MKKIPIIFLFLLTLGNFANATTSIEFALMGKETWSAFECSVLAERSKKTKEQERLFVFGYEKGLEFINALKQNKIKQKDLKSEVPLYVLWSLEGPTADFMLGRIFEVVVDSILKDVIKTGTQINSNEEQKIISQNKFFKQNCQLIGRY